MDNRAFKQRRVSVWLVGPRGSVVEVFDHSSTSRDSVTQTNGTSANRTREKQQRIEKERRQRS